MTRPALIYLFGYPGVGKNTIARAIEAQSDFIAVQNHLLSNALRHALSRQPPENYPLFEPALKHHTMKAWLNFLEFIAAAVPQQNLVLTSVLYDDDPDRVQFFEFIRDWTRQQNRHFLPVRLVCEEGELLRRAQSPDRRSEFKLHDDAILQKLLRDRPLLQDPVCMELDVTNLAAADAAAQILSRLGQV